MMADAPWPCRGASAPRPRAAAAPCAWVGRQARDALERLLASSCKRIDCSLRASQARVLLDEGLLAPLGLRRALLDRRARARQALLALGELDPPLAELALDVGRGS